MTLVERAVRCARKAQLLDDFVVSTDDDETEELASRLGAPVYRRARREDGPMVDVLREVLNAWPDWTMNPDCDAVVTIQPTSPLRTSEDVDDCIRLWQRMRSTYEWGDGTNAVTPVVSVVSGGPPWRRNGAVYVTPVDCMREGHVFHGCMCDEIHIMPASRSLDINEPADLEEARRILGP